VFAIFNGRGCDQENERTKTEFSYDHFMPQTGRNLNVSASEVFLIVYLEVSGQLNIGALMLRFCLLHFAPCLNFHL